MLIEIQNRKCLRCGTTFTHTLGGIVLVTTPKCPQCGSRLTLRTGRLF
ncbi:MAG: hydrogenase maturation nickel metallochaperone HypA [Bacteroides sp.]|nr:hydrogenase maturation nickel metallochaperone HypA [Bacteroides sp.]